MKPALHTLSPLLLACTLACSGSSAIEKADSPTPDDARATQPLNASPPHHAEDDTDDENAMSHHDHHDHQHHATPHTHKHGHHNHRFESPEDYVERWNSPERDSWQRPTAVVEAMSITTGMSVADIGAGTGYFIPHLSAQVGPEGHVFAVDTEEAMLGYIQEQARTRGWDNIKTIQATPNASGLEEAQVDRILTVNTWHHIPEREAYAAHLKSRLRPGGSLWIVDISADSPMGPPPEHRLSPEQIIAELEAGGFQAELYDLKLERQFIIVGRFHD
ncbi:hypothetical protein DL240_00725 [Lujinxingia litoralis]|uniref:Methyltransferase domain-containing protein n=1 Tax=Lujinxingia litoralis TaxID=2211119 RepID=A0A328CAS2_9DELT|nr:class I SAM-dependent methyltransferase [Lujinxingia litoralis]RAL24766.1 hypothetical protein DL240_00725 [Lujinxingia litoralis]